MEWYKGKYENCIAYDNQVTQGENYVQNDNWANPIEREGSWYILKHENYASEMELVNELPKQNDLMEENGI